MKVNLNRVVVLLFGLVVFAAGHSHEATERYIPIGKSPGMSSKYTVTGTIDTVDREKKTMTMTGNGTRYSVAYTKQTRIWIDRSQAKLTSLNGSFADLEPGRYVEVKYADPELRKTAEWIKVRMP